MINEKNTPLTLGQKEQLLRVLEEAMDSLSLTMDQANDILKIENLVQSGLKNNINKYLNVDKCFGPAIVEFELTIPLDFIFCMQIDSTIKKAKEAKNILYCNDDFCSNNFSNATNRLIPGNKYKIVFTPIISLVSNEDCMVFLKKKNSILVGGQGAMLIYDLKRDEFPSGKYNVSFDEQEKLWKDGNGFYRAPSVRRRTNGSFEFRLEKFNRDLYTEDCILCVYEVK